jgi:hypothetical protein
MRVGFFLRHRFHAAIMEPIYNLLRERCDCRLFTPQPADVSRDPFGIQPIHEVIADLVAFRPHVVLSGEDIHPLHLRLYLPQTLFVHTRHGLASKGFSYQSVQSTDYACVTSPYMRQWYLEAGVQPHRGFWEVGYPQMDSLFSAQPPALPPSLAASLSAHKRVVLYAPTFQASLSSARLLGTRTVELLLGERRDVALIIKPHPLIGNLFPEWMRHWRNAASERPDVYLVEDTHSDVMPYLKAADVLVTDVSSVSLEFLALNRPMVLVTSPYLHEEPFVDRNGFEWRWRDMGHEIFDVAQLPAAVSTALDQPEVGSDRRQHYHHLLFGDLADGKASCRLADNIAALAPEAASEWRMSLGSKSGRLAVKAGHWKGQIRTWRMTSRLWAN